MSKIKNGGLDQYGAGPFEQQQFGAAGVERVKHDIVTGVITLLVYNIHISFYFCLFIIFRVSPDIISGPGPGRNLAKFSYLELVE